MKKYINYFRYKIVEDDNVAVLIRFAIFFGIVFRFIMEMKNQNNYEKIIWISAIFYMIITLVFSVNNLINNNENSEKNKNGIIMYDIFFISLMIFDSNNYDTDMYLFYFLPLLSASEKNSRVRKVFLIYVLISAIYCSAIIGICISNNFELFSIFMIIMRNYVPRIAFLLLVPMAISTKSIHLKNQSKVLNLLLDLQYKFSEKLNIENIATELAKSSFLISKTIFEKEPEFVSIHLYDEMKKKLYFASVYPENMKEKCKFGDIYIKSINKGLIGKAFIKKEIKIINEVSKNVDYNEIWAKTISEISVPIMYNDYAIGVINIEYNSKLLGRQDINYTLRYLSYQSGLAINNSKILRNLNEQNNILSKLNLISENIPYINNKQQMAMELLLAIKTIVNFDKATFQLIHGNDKNRSIIAQIGESIPCNNVDLLMPPIEDKLILDVIRRRDIYYIYDVGKHELWKKHECTKDTISWICIPLWLKFKLVDFESDEIYGVIILDFEKKFELNTDKRLAIRLFQQFTSAIFVNALIKEQYSEKNKDLEDLLEKYEKVIDLFRAYESLARVGLVFGDLMHSQNNYIGYVRDQLLEISNSDAADIKITQIKMMTEEMYKALTDYDKKIHELRNNSYNELLNSKVNISKVVQDIIVQESVYYEKVNLIEKYPKIATYIKAPKHKIYSIIQNVINNAFKAISIKGDKIIVIVKAEKSKKNIKIIVEDNGIGISEEQKENLFTWIEKETWQINKYKGMGMGLAWARDYLVLFGGDIKLSSKLGIGTKVTITLPMEFLESMDAI